MNHIYRLLWNRRLAMFVPVSENGPGVQQSSGRTRRRQQMRSAMMMVLAAGAVNLADANPVGGQVSAGAASISQHGNVTTVSQASQNVSLNWQSFNVAPNQSVNYIQPNAQSIAVNRILGNQGSQILGHINANGQVWLINPNGILFGPGAQVNVGGLVASTLSVADTQLGAAQRQFAGNGSGSVINQGSLNAAPGGYVALLGPQVSNTGTITAPGGMVALGAGTAQTLTFADNTLLALQIDQSTLNNLAANSGLIQADGGSVILSAGAKDAVLASVVNNTGIIEARTAADVSGKITLLGGMEAGTVNLGGTLDASAPQDGNGGAIETSAAHVEMAPGLNVTTASSHGQVGSWLIDPQDYTIANSGGDITGAQLGALLANNNITIVSDQGATAGNGDINVNAAVSWNTVNTLTLNAERNVNFNTGGSVTSNTGSLTVRADLGATGNGTINMNGGTINISGGGNIQFYYNPAVFGTATNFGNVTFSGSGSANYYMLVETPAELQNINENPAGSYALATNINASTITNFTPISAFSGKLNGQYYTISNLTENHPSAAFYVGLFNQLTSTSLVSNLTLANINVTGGTGTGGLAGALSGGTVSNVNITSGTVTGIGAYVGGLIGSIGANSTISHSSNSANVSGSLYYIGGLAGYVAGGAAIGNSYSSGQVIGSNTVGGFVGYNAGTISNSYTSDTIAAGNGAVTIGGFVGNNAGTLSNVFWDSTVSGQASGVGSGSSSGVMGMSTANMQAQANYTSATSANGNVNPGWNFSSIWSMGSGSYLYPVFQAPTPTVSYHPLTVANLTAQSKVYDDTVVATSTASLDGVLAGDTVNLALGSSQFSDKNVGTGKTVTLNGASINGASASSYQLVPAAGMTTTANITPLPITVTATALNKVYDATVNDTATLFSNGILNGDSVSFADTSVAFSDKNVGNNKTVTVSGITASGSDAGNYSVNSIATTTANITPLTISVMASGVNKVYDATINDAVLLSSTGILSGDSVSFGDTSATFANKNVGANKSVMVTGITASGADAGNYVLNNSSATTTASITPLAITVAAVGVNKVYDATVNDAASLSSSGVLNGDSVSFNDSSATFANKNVGTNKTVTISGISASGTDAGNYILNNSSATTTASITPLAITVAATGVNKVYDATVNDIATLSSTGVLSGDSVSFSDTSATFANKNVGTNKTVVVSGITVSGADAGNYTVNASAATTANVTPLAITVAATGVNKVYDATINDTATLSSGGVLSGDSVSFNDTSATFSDKNVGNNKLVTVSGISASGADAGNYTINTSASTTASITPLAITVAATGVDKIYDATVNDPATLSSTGILSGDSVNFGDTSATFANKNVGNNKSVTVTGITVSGTDAGNYVLNNNSATTTASITPLAITVAATGANKVYDATVNDTATLSSNGVLSGDSVSFSDTSATFSDKNVGNNKLVTVSGISTSGTDAGNYTVNNTASTTANITPLAIMVAATGANKVYDATVNDTATLSSNGVLSGDSVSFSDTSAIFSDKNVGNNKLVTVSGISASGTDAGNYTVNTTTSTTANITPLAITVAATGVNKVYDATVNDPATLSSSGVVGGDSVTFSDTSAIFSDKNVGANKTVTVSGISASGTDASNYVLNNNSATTTANITPLAITVAATGVSKIYDANVNDAATLSSTGVLGTDSVTFSDTSAVFSDKNVGNNKPVTVSGISASGSDASNYTVNTAAITTANITPLPITVTATGANKVYDATVNDPVSLASTGVLTGDSVTFSDTSAAFADKNVGTNKLVTVNGIGATGTDAANYTFNTSATTTADITPLAITVIATGVNQVYNASSNATVILSSNGVLSGDSITFSDTSASFANKNVGLDKTITVTGISASGPDAGDYVLNNTSATATANITPAVLSYVAAPIQLISGTGVSSLSGKVSGLLPGDTLANSTSGSLTWVVSNAASTSRPGQYQVAGTGLSSENYVLVEAPGNQEALIVVPSAAGLSLPPASLLPSTGVGFGSNGISGSSLASAMEPIDPALGNYADQQDLAQAANHTSLHIVNGGIRGPVDDVLPSQ